MLPEYGERVEGSRELRQAIVESLEGSLQRVGTDHFDIADVPRTEPTCPEDLTPRDRRGLPAT